MIAQRATQRRHDEYAAHLDAIEREWFAWFAGWLCADGSIKGAGDRPQISFALTDRDPLDNFAERLGNTVGGPYAPSGLGKRPRYTWKISGWKAALILPHVAPWLSERYAQRARAALDGWQMRGHAGRKLTPEDVAVIKRELASGAWGVGTELAERFGVSRGMITAIKKGRVWTD